MMDVSDALWVPGFQSHLTNLSPLEKVIVVHPKPHDGQYKLGNTSADSPLRRPVSSKADSKKVRINFSDVSAQDAAKLITLHEQLLLRSVPVFECASLLPFMPGGHSLRPRLLSHRDEVWSFVLSFLLCLRWFAG